MKLLCIISILTLTALALAESWLLPEPPLEFDIDTTYIPEDCTVLSAEGDDIRVHVVGTVLETGKIFSSSYHFRDGQPSSYTVGRQGLTDGLVGMCEGEKRTLMIPYARYGPMLFDEDIPSDSTLVFETELVKLTKKHTEL